MKRRRYRYVWRDVRTRIVNDIVDEIVTCGRAFARADPIFATLKAIVDDETSTISSTISLRVAWPLTSDGVTSHPSCQLITSNIQTPIHFDFKLVTQENIQALISKCISKKATGIDGIPAIFFKSCCRTISKPLSKLINYSLSNSTFPNRLKLAQVIPVYKKNDPLDKHNYRPISILPFMSKRFEKCINLQLSTHFENFFNPFIGAFRQGMGCPSTLLRLVEDWRRAVDSNEYVAAILMDLSRAFDSLPHDML